VSAGIPRGSDAAASSAFLPRGDFDRLLAALRADGRVVVGPTIRDGAVAYTEIADAGDLPVGWQVDSSPGSYRLEASGRDRAFDYGVGVTAWKRFTHPPRVPLTTTATTGLVEAVEPDVQRMAFIGVRACELAALDIQERVMRAGPAGDADHAARREASLVVAVECAVAMSTCFCTSMGTGPEVTDGADIVLAELDDGFTVRAVTPAGKDVVEALALPEATAQQLVSAADQVAAVRARIGDPVPTEGLPERLRAAPEHPRWDEVAERCLACTNCTLVCPTCFCTSVSVSSDLDGATGSTDRVWDSCFTLGFGRVAGDANFRPRVADRYRQWLTHKFSSWWDQFGSTGCVGCGRCITWCPVAIDITEEVAAIRATEEG
jgi:formate hydrogenlyase subunit 6/NADH:ubiquinone oxidoreductase subunit I